MNISLSISPAPSITDKIAVIIYAASAPGVIVDSQEFNPPHSSPRNITFANVEPVVYIVNTYETTGLPTLGTLRHSFIYQPTYIGAEIKPTEFLEMVAGATAYTDTNWIGWDIESIERVGVGTQYDGGASPTIVIRTDGFDLAVSGDQFGADEKWVVRFYPRITVTNPVFRSSKIVRGSQILDSDITLTETEAGIALRLKGASGHFTVTLPDQSGIEDFSMFVFISDGGQHINVTIDGNGYNFDYIGNRAYMVLAQNERIFVVNDNANNEWLIIKASDTIGFTGRIIEMYDKPANAYDRNYVFANGAELSRIQYKRLFDYYSTLPVSAQTTKALWLADDEKKALWHDGDGITTFGLPRLYTTGILKAVDGSARLPGSYEAGQVGQFTITVPKVKLAGGGGIVDVISEYGLPPAFVSGTTDKTFLSTLENRVKNTGIYKLIHI